MKKILSSALLGLLLSGCTIYRSDGRKQFESEALTKINAANAATSSATETSETEKPASNEEKEDLLLPEGTPFQLKSCKREGRLETWFNEEFPAHTYELVIAESDLEIWRTHHGHVIEVKALQKSDRATHSCVYEFANEMVWNLYKEPFIRELENNLMTIE